MELIPLHADLLSFYLKVIDVCEDEYKNIEEAEQHLREICEETSGIAALADTLFTTNPVFVIGTIGELRDTTVEIVDACDYIHKDADNRLKCILANRKPHDEAMAKIERLLTTCMER